jgi:hypothetical protein
MEMLSPGFIGGITPKLAQVKVTVFTTPAMDSDTAVT